MAASNLTAELMKLVGAYRVSQAIHVAATLGIADLLKEGTRSSNDLAAATNSHPETLYRLLRTLAAAGLFHEHGDKSFSVTPQASPHFDLVDKKAIKSMHRANPLKILRV
jgi:DNA-binding IclR family transcriptional regulator